jgi:SAM-dependent methyltransferase
MTTMLPTDWPIAFFDDDYLKIYRPMLTAEQTSAEVEFIVRELALPAGGKVLDLACGTGRHAIAMAERGFAVTGVDFNPRYLALAEEAAGRAGVSVVWTQSDMRELAFTRAFDAAYSFFTSFGYYTDDENERVLVNIARALAPGGRFLIDVMNRDFLLTHPRQRTWMQRDDGALLMEENTIDLTTSRVTSRQLLIEPSGGSRVTKEYDLRAYTCAELSALMRRHGLRVDRVLGGADGSDYSTDSRRLVIVATAV